MVDVATGRAPVSESRLLCLDNSCDPVFFLLVSGVLDELAKFKSSKRRPALDVPRRGDVSEPLGAICLPVSVHRFPTLSDSELESEERPESLRADPAWRRFFLSDGRSGSGASSSSSEAPRVFFVSLLP